MRQGIAAVMVGLSVLMPTAVSMAQTETRSKADARAEEVSRQHQREFEQREREQKALRPYGREADTWWTLSQKFGGAKADTKPSRSTWMRFSIPTEIREVLVTPGQKVKAGELLIRARDAEVLAALKLQQIQSENRNQILAAEQRLRLAQSRHDKGKGSGTLSPAEIIELEVALESARIELEQAKVEFSQESVRLDQLKAQAERYRLEAPFDGVVQELKVEVGQGVNEQLDVIRVVSVDTLWVEPAPPTGLVVRLGLKPGSPAWVLIDTGGAGGEAGESGAGGGKPVLLKGKVLYAAPVADSVSETCVVRVEVENTPGLKIGTQARVRFEEPGPEWDQYKPDTDRVKSETIPATDENAQREDAGMIDTLARGGARVSYESATADARESLVS